MILLHKYSWTKYLNSRLSYYVRLVDLSPLWDYYSSCSGNNLDTGGSWSWKSKTLRPLYWRLYYCSKSRQTLHPKSLTAYHIRAAANYSLLNTKCNISSCSWWGMKQVIPPKIPFPWERLAPGACGKNVGKSYQVSKEDANCENSNLDISDSSKQELLDNYFLMDVINLIFLNSCH